MSCERRGSCLLEDMATVIGRPGERTDALPAMPEGEAALAAFRAYATAFGALDARGAAACFDEPAVVVTPRDRIAAASRSEVERAYEAIMEEARRQGYAGTLFDHVEGRTLDAETEAVTGSGLWRNAAGDVLLRFELTYVFRRIEGKWRIVLGVVREVDAPS